MTEYRGVFPDLDRELDVLAELHELHPAPVEACRAMTWPDPPPLSKPYRGPEQPLPAPSGPRLGRPHIRLPWRPV